MTICACSAALGVGSSGFSPHPSSLTLFPAYPNPFNQSSVVSYQLYVAGDVSLRLYDPCGRLVQTLVNGRQSAGEHQGVIGQARSPALPSGIYFIQLQAGGEVMTQKAFVIR